MQQTPKWVDGPCAICGKRITDGPAVVDTHEDKVYHEHCDPHRAAREEHWKKMFRRVR